MERIKLIFSQKKELGILALLCAVFLWGPAPVLTKLALYEIPPFTLAFLRGVLALAIVFLIFFPRGYFTFHRKDIWKFLAAGFAGQGLNVGLFFYGIQTTSAITAQAIFTLAPIGTALFAYFFLKERITWIQIGGAALGFGGALLVAFHETFETGVWQTGTLQGNFLIFLAMLSWVAYILISKHLSRAYSPITITSFSFVVGAIWFFPLALGELLHDSSWMSGVHAGAWFSVIYLGVFASVIAFLAYQTGLQLTSAFTAGLVLYLNPILTTLVAVPVLGEKITSLFAVGALFIIVGSFTATQFETIKNHIRKRL